MEDDSRRCQRSPRGPQEDTETAGSRRDRAGRGDVESTLLYRCSSVVYQCLALSVAVSPLLAPAGGALMLLDGRTAWSLIGLLASLTVALSSLPGLAYAVTRPGWTTDPSACRRMRALWRGWRSAVGQFGPLALLTTAFVLGLSSMSAGASGWLRVSTLVLLALAWLMLVRAGTICALFSFRLADLLVLTLVMSVRDAAGTLFLAALQAVGLFLLLHDPPLALLCWIPLAAACAPATRRARLVLTEQFTASPAAVVSNACRVPSPAPQS